MKVVVVADKQEKDLFGVRDNFADYSFATLLVTALCLSNGMETLERQQPAASANSSAYLITFYFYFSQDIL